MIKTILIFLLALPIFANNAQINEAGYSNYAVVFMYHRFGESKYPSTNITIEQFQYHIDYLEKNNYNVWPLSKIVNYIVNKKPIPEKTVALTMDDSYKSVYTHAYPMLKAKRFPFTVFVNTTPIDHKSRAFTTWDQIRTMQRDGGEFVNHSLEHQYLLPQEDETKIAWIKRVTDEVLKAQLRLDDELSTENTKFLSYPFSPFNLDISKKENIKLFSYPYGEYNLEMSKLIQELGYIGIVQTSGPMGFDSDLGALPRFAMAESFAGADGFKTKLNTLPFPIKSVSNQDPVIKNQNPPRLRIQLKEKIDNLNCFISSGEHINIEWISKTEVEIFAKEPISSPRDRYTCTAPAKDKKWYWYSHLWINQ